MSEGFKSVMNELKLINNRLGSLQKKLQRIDNSILFIPILFSICLLLAVIAIGVQR